MTRRITRLALAAALAAAPVLASTPVGVSPGAPDRLLTVEQRCPTFSWTEVDGGLGYQVLAYALPADPAAELELAPEALVLATRVPARAISWTPAADTCFAPGGVHVWFVRAVLAEEDGVVTEASDWSEGLYFAVPAAVGLEGGDAPERALAPHDGRRLLGGGGAPARAASSRSVPTAPAAVRGDAPDTAGEVYGVLGSTASPAGAGLAAANSGGGPDLVLDGSADGAVNTLVTESGVDRPAATNQRFTVTNSGLGSLTLEADRFAGNGSALTALNASNLASGTVPSARLSGTYSELVTFANAGNVFAGDGSALTGIDADTVGGLEPGALLPGSRWGMFSTATLGDGSYPAITIGSDGLPLISYVDAGALKVAHCEDLACSAATTTVIADSISVGQHCSFAVGADGLGLVSYIDLTNDALKVAHCENLACSAATTTTIDAGSFMYNSLAIGADGLGLVAYCDLAAFDLKVAHCSDTACTSATVTALDTSGVVGIAPSVAIGVDGRALISYSDNNSFDVNVAHCDGLACTSATITRFGGAGFEGFKTSLTIGADGLGLISFADSASDYSLGVIHCGNVTCSSYERRLLGGSGVMATSITVAPDGLPQITYHVDGGSLWRAHCSDLECSDATTMMVRPAEVAHWFAVATGADGLPLLVHHQADLGQLLVTHCSNRFCVPWVRPR